MRGPAPGIIDKLHDQLPPGLKWCLAGIGGVAGFHYAQQHGSSIPQSCIIGGAAAGLCMIALLFASLHLLKVALIVATVAVVVNYAVLIPYGYGNHMPACIKLARAAGSAVLDGVHRLADNWGRYGG